MSGFWKSFFAAVIVAPFYFFVLMQQFQMGGGEGSPAHFLAIQAIAYVVAWVLFPFVFAFHQYQMARELNEMLVAQNKPAVPGIESPTSGSGPV